MGKLEGKTMKELIKMSHGVYEVGMTRKELIVAIRSEMDDAERLQLIQLVYLDIYVDTDDKVWRYNIGERDKYLDCYACGNPMDDSEYSDDWVWKESDKSIQCHYDCTLIGLGNVRIKDGDIQHLFGGLFRDCQLEYTRHRPEKGESWMTMDLSSLKTMLGLVVYRQVTWGKGTYAEYEELIDSILLTLMTAQRMRDKLVDAGEIKGGGDKECQE